MVKNSPADSGDAGLIPESGRSPGEGNGNPLQYSCLENPMDGKALVGYSPWGCKESDTTERLHFHFHRQMGVKDRSWGERETESCKIIARFSRKVKE